MKTNLMKDEDEETHQAAVGLLGSETREEIMK